MFEKIKLNNILKIFVCLMLLLVVPTSVVGASTNVSKTKTASLTCGGYGSITAKDTATRNTTTGSWSTNHVVANTTNLSSSYRASASEGGSKDLTNDGLTLTHNAGYAIYNKSNSMLTGVYFKVFTFNYNINTKVIS